MGTDDLSTGDVAFTARVGRAPYAPGMTPPSGATRGATTPSRIPSTSPLHEPRELTAEERAWFREKATTSRRAKAAAVSGQGPEPIHRINTPRLNPVDLMPDVGSAGLASLSLFSGGGGLDLGFSRGAGFDHAASFEILDDAAATLVKGMSRLDCLRR